MPIDAVTMPSEPCIPESQPGLLEPCDFGAPLGADASEFALLGDSHADHWRAALKVVADALNWTGISLTRPRCPYSEATPVVGNGGGDTLLLVAQCLVWRSEVKPWFVAHPEVHTVFVSEHAMARIRAAPGRSVFATQVRAYRAALSNLPASVRHIVVIRDSPFIANGASACVTRAVSEHRQAGTICGVPRDVALLRDPEVAAARELGRRASVIDMSNFFCGRKLCYPVIGGALVYKDAEHITASYGETLGPYVLRQVKRLLSRWRQA